jgi:hypothetical protein
MAEKPIVETTEEASGGVRRQGLSTMLVVGLVLVVAAFIVVALVVRPMG